ncbi:hypothetical protein [Streptomyces lasiicapitis]|uniref:Uncharacterized protein n=1 Tax=Streptomyces lasiicapitis TaxID=1923961 RepID=A0ABQ2LIJ8_9ACTN|nr:hypothetical protein [Streptomyces lasiicapitis]GGO34717.1 hypothetical protein GCM10012286_04220 [Streptomyces lasiicapitis]
MTALNFGDVWGGRFLLYAVALGVVLPMLPRPDRYTVLHGTVLALAVACLLAGVVANAASHHHGEGN